MTVTTTSVLASSIRTRYMGKYYENVKRRRLYDMFAIGADQVSAAAGDAQTMEQMAASSSVQVNFLSDMKINLNALSEVSDINPQTLSENTATITTNHYGDAVQTSDEMDIRGYLDWAGAQVEKVSLNMMENVEELALRAALQGGLSERTAATRAAVDAGTATHRATNDMFWYISARLQGFMVPGYTTDDGGAGTSWACATDSFVLHDIVTTADILNVAQYQQSELILNGELGRLNNFKLIQSAFTKNFWGAGIANGTDVDTTLSAAATALDKTITVTANTNMAVGDWLNIITAKESGNTYYSENERVKITAINSTVISIAGMGSDGGLRWDHANGAIVNKDDSVHTLLFAGPASLWKVFSPGLGEFGTMVPNNQGILDQWNSLGWKWYGGYSRPIETHLYRAEVSVEEEA